MTDIQRFGESRRWADMVVHGGTARWVEVADDPTQDARGQIAQVLTQIDATLARLAIDRTRLLQVTIFLTDVNDAPTLNEQWDAWVPAGHAPVRACLGAALSKGYAVEIIIEAAMP